MSSRQQVSAALPAEVREKLKSPPIGTLIAGPVVHCHGRRKEWAKWHGSTQECGAVSIKGSIGKKEHKLSFDSQARICEPFWHQNGTLAHSENFMDKDTSRLSVKRPKSDMIGNPPMQFDLVRNDRVTARVLYTVDSLAEAFDLAGACALEAYNAGKMGDVFAVVQMPGDRVVFFCQHQPDVGLHYWSPTDHTPSTNQM